MSANCSFKEVIAASFNESGLKRFDHPSIVGRRHLDVSDSSLNLVVSVANFSFVDSSSLFALSASCIAFVVAAMASLASRSFSAF